MSIPKEEVEFVWSGTKLVELEKSNKANSYEELYSRLEDIEYQLDELGQLENKVNRAREWKDVSFDFDEHIFGNETKIKWIPNNFEVKVRYGDTEQSDFETVEAIDQAIQKMREILKNHKKRQEGYIEDAKEFLKVK